VNNARQLLFIHREMKADRDDAVLWLHAVCSLRPGGLKIEAEGQKWGLSSLEWADSPRIPTA